MLRLVVALASNGLFVSASSLLTGEQIARGRGGPRHSSSMEMEASSVKLNRGQFLEVDDPSESSEVELTWTLPRGHVLLSAAQLARGRAVPDVRSQANTQHEGTTQQIVAEELPRGPDCGGDEVESVGCAPRREGGGGHIAGEEEQSMLQKRDASADLPTDEEQMPAKKFSADENFDLQIVGKEQASYLQEGELAKQLLLTSADSGEDEAEVAKAAGKESPAPVGKDSPKTAREKLHHRCCHANFQIFIVLCIGLVTFVIFFIHIVVVMANQVGKSSSSPHCRGREDGTRWNFFEREVSVKF